MQLCFVERRLCKYYGYFRSSCSREETGKIMESRLAASQALTVIYYYKLNTGAPVKIYILYLLSYINIINPI